MCLRIMSLSIRLLAAQALSSACDAKTPSTTNSDAVHVPPEPVSPTAPTSSASAPYDPGGADEASGAAKDADSDEDDGEDEYHSVPRGKRPSSPAAPDDGRSLFGSSDEDEDAVDVETTYDDEVASDHESESILVSSDSCDDLKHVDDDDNPDDVGDLDSGEEPEQDNIVVGAVPEEDSEYEGGDAVEAQIKEENEDPNSLNAIAEQHFADKFLHSLGDTEKVLAGDVVGKNLNKLHEHSTSGWTEPVYPDVFQHPPTSYEPVDETNNYSDLQKEPFGPTPEAMKCGDSPLALFFFFMPVAIWQHIVVCCNSYKHEQFEAWVDAYIEPCTSP
ncbi:hypothetical protein Pcac1_g18913 [Phytophthora cactorum]|nr:hypothetical protein Pcac1_g18913 [Phytophthora cactorum]KAG2832495.1 hypothetical protein PC111_g6583 [Phytophthora cactorum]